MKKVLIIARLPHASPRIPGLAKYLPEFNWQPIVLTTSWPLSSQAPFLVTETEYRDALDVWKRWFRLHSLSRSDEDIRGPIKERLGTVFGNSLAEFILTRIGEVVNYPDGDRGWKPFALEVGDELLQPQDIDILISSSSPVTSHLIARKLKAKHKVPWVADFRDLWSRNHNYRYGPIRKLLDKRLELKTLSLVDDLVTVSQPWAEELATLHNRPFVHTITNGFDPQEQAKDDTELTAKFTITYTGLFLTRRDPTNLFVALRELIQEGKMNSQEVEVRFYGIKISWLSEQIGAHGLSDIVRCYEEVPWQVSLEKQRESQVLLLLNWDDPRGKGVHPLKCFEYLGSRRPILAVGGFGDDVTEKLLNETKAGKYCITAENVKAALVEWYSAYKASGRVDYAGDDKEISKYSHREMARKFSEILDRLTPR
jgi:glycosyltransferase involved in cell wall biosynthesis